MSACALFSFHKFNAKKFLSKLKFTKIIDGLDLSNCTLHSEAFPEFLDSLFTNNYLIKQLRFSLDQISKDFCKSFSKHLLLHCKSLNCLVR